MCQRASKHFDISREMHLSTFTTITIGVRGDIPRVISKYPFSLSLKKFTIIPIRCACCCAVVVVPGGYGTLLPIPPKIQSNSFPSVVIVATQ